MAFLGVKISAELETLIDEEVKRSDKSKSDIVRDALNQYFNVAIPEGTGLIVLDKNELIKLIDSRLGVKPEVKQEGLTVKPAPDVKQNVKPEGKTVKPEVKPTPPEDTVTAAKRYILAELEAGREPTAAEVAEHVGMKSRPLGVLMSKAGVQAKLTGTGNNKVRRYTFELKERIEELLAVEDLPAAEAERPG
jgi:predicted transcriptional regulator